MTQWNLALEVADGAEPLFRRIAATIAADIARGRLRHGAKLASSRALADQLGVSRNTVVAAYDELCAQGLITLEPTRGAYVIGARRHACLAPGGAAGPAPLGPGFDLPATLAGKLLTPRAAGTLLLLGGVPELRDLPYRAIARAYRSALVGRSVRRLMDYADPQGNLRLRAALSELMASVRGVTASVEAITVVRGTTHGLSLTAHALLEPGDVVAVEAPGYLPAWRAFELAGAEVVPLPVDHDGLDIDALAALCETRTVRAVYTTPHHQHPTTVTLSAERRQRLLALAAARRMIVLEDDYDFEFHYASRPVLPLAAADPAGVVVYLGTLSKTLAPGLRIGYLVAHPAVAQRIAAYRGFTDGQGDHALEHAVALLLEDGEIQRHVRRVHRAYRARREALAQALRRRLPELAFTPPRGGMALWAQLPGVDTAAWAQRGLAHGVAFQPGERFWRDGAPRDHIRLGFAACTELELVEAVDRMVRALPAT